jgi:hypothetical protein
LDTWGIGPFANDTAADFAYSVDEMAEQERESLARTTLVRVVETRDYLESPEDAEAVATAALVAAQCPGGELISTSYRNQSAVHRASTRW